MLTGLSTPSAGQVYWHDQPIATAEPNVSIVFQSFALFPWLTVLENVEAPLQARGMDAAEQRQPRLEDPGHGRPGRLPVGVPEGAFGRDAAAGGLCARAGGGAGGPVHGRAVLGAGRADGGEPAQRTAGAVAEEDDPHQGDLSRHAQHRGGGAAGRPHHRAGAQSGRGADGLQGDAAASARPQERGVYAAGGLHLQGADAAGRAASGAAHAPPERGKPAEPRRRTTRSCRTRGRAASPDCWSCCSTTTARTTSTGWRTTLASRSTTCCRLWTRRSCWAS